MVKLLLILTTDKRMHHSRGNLMPIRTMPLLWEVVHFFWFAPHTIHTHNFCHKNYNKIDWYHSQHLNDKKLFWLIGWASVRFCDIQKTPISWFGSSTLGGEPFLLLLILILIPFDALNVVDEQNENNVELHKSRFQTIKSSLQINKNSLQNKW